MRWIVIDAEKTGILSGTGNFAEVGVGLRRRDPRRLPAARGSCRGAFFLAWETADASHSEARLVRDIAV
jgi:hypothetical protein